MTQLEFEIGEVSERMIQTAVTRLAQKLSDNHLQFTSQDYDQARDLYNKYIQNYISEECQHLNEIEINFMLDHLPTFNDYWSFF